MTDSIGGFGPRFDERVSGAVPRMLGGRYELAQQIGRGGMAEVYAGRDTRLGRTVAVKVLKTDLARDPAFQSRFKREAQSAASLNHPAIVAVYDTGDEEMTEPGGHVTHLPYIVMEYLRGRTLKEVLNQHHQLSTEDALRVTAGVLDALQYSHQHGIVHRDIKPANVMVTEAGEIKVMDFGIARAIADTGATMTGTNAVLGTAQYLSPEQAKGENVDNRSDLYSTACLLYELLTGRPPFVGDSPVSLAYQHVGEQAAPPSTLVPGVPPDLDRVVMRGLAKDRDLRYQSAEEFIADLDRVANGVAVTTPAVTQAVRPTVPPPAGATQRMAPAVPAAWPPATQPPPPSPAGYGRPQYDAGYDDYDEPPRRNLLWLWIVLGVLAVGAIIALALVLTSGDDQTPAGDPTSSSTLPTSQAITTVAVPDVRNLTYEDASAQLKNLGFTNIARGVDVESTDVEPGIVVEQTPVADPANPLPLDTLITLVAAKEPGQVAVPDVTGLSQADARTAIEDAGLRVGNVDSEDAPTTERGQVVRTDPAIGTGVAPNTTVAIWTSTGQVDVPDVEGLDINAANDALRERGLTSLQSPVADASLAGTVISQNPQSGRVDNGAQIELLVSTGPGVTVTQSSSSSSSSSTVVTTTTTTEP